MRVEIDPNSGFCHGVVKAINKAEEILKENGSLYCLGDIVHNGNEVERLQEKGLKTIDHESLKQLQKTKVLIRAHGEPPGIYRLAKDKDIEVIDATCPVVLSLQKKVRKGFEEMQAVGGQVVIYGKKGHAEVIGLEGQTDGKAIIISSLEDLHLIDFTKPLVLFSQTTKDLEGYAGLTREIEIRYQANKKPLESFFKVYQTICKQVSNRKPTLTDFCKNHDVIVFVSGQKSSNGRMLFELCKRVNQRSYFVSFEDEINREWFVDARSVGISGATSTPKWLMEKIADKIKSL